jgi:hypothetical protein
MPRSSLLWIESLQPERYQSKRDTANYAVNIKGKYALYNGRISV